MHIIENLYEGELRTSSVHLKSGNKIITDAPIDNQGKGEAFSPTDLVCSALGSCMITIMGIKARDMGISIDGTKMHITKIMASDPRRIAEIKVEFYFPANGYSEKEKIILERAAKTCPVALSLSNELVQQVEFNFGG